MSIQRELATAKTAMVVNAGFFASILYEKGLLEIAYGDVWRGSSCPTAMTDGKHIVVSEGWFFSLSTSQQVFVLCHEVVHLFSRHPSRLRFYIENGIEGEKLVNEIAQISMDAVINKLLRDGKFGTQPGGINMEKELKEQFDYKLTGMERWEIIYALLLEDAKGKGLDPETHEHGDPIPGLAGSGSGQPMDGDVQMPSSMPGEEPASPREMRAAVKSALRASKSQGKVPGNLLSLIEEFVEPEVDWREELAKDMMAFADPDHWTWKRGHRRMMVSHRIYMPSRVGMKAGHGIIAVDTSGSITDHHLALFGGEMCGILNIAVPSSLHVIWCDAQVDRVDELDDAEGLLNLVRVEGIPGRGGTSFIPPFEYIRDNQMECDFMVYMTDLYGPVPDASLMPCDNVIWLVVNNDKDEGPFGRTIHMKETSK